MTALTCPPEGVTVPERRSAVAALDGVEWRETDDKIEFRGHAAVFDRLSDDLGGFREQIQRGAFRSVLSRNPDVAFLGFNHDPNTIMARTTNGTLQLAEDPKGLAVNADLAPTTDAKNLRVLVKRGDVSQMSFGFRLNPKTGGKDSWSEDNGAVVRTIQSFSQLLDVSPVVGPAYQETTASMRALVCGEEIVNSVGALDEERLVDLAWRIHRGDVCAALEERAALDALFSRTDTVSPWTAQRALGALRLAPELAGPPPAHRLAARKRRLALAARKVGIDVPVQERAAATDKVAVAQSALTSVHSLIAAEAAEAGSGDDDAAEDADDVKTLREAAAALVTYVAATSAEVATDDDDQMSSQQEKDKAA